jgi:phosphomannomutase
MKLKEYANIVDIEDLTEEVEANIYTTKTGFKYFVHASKQFWHFGHCAISHYRTGRHLITVKKNVSNVRKEDIQQALDALFKEHGGEKEIEKVAKKYRTVNYE